MTQPHSPEAGNPRALISDRVVRLVRDYTGRGPTQAKTTLVDDLAVVILRDTLTREERTLVDHGVPGDVLRTRRTVQDAMRVDLTKTVEAQTGRNVIAFMSANHIDPDISAEIFVLAPHIH